MNTNGKRPLKRRLAIIAALAVVLALLGYAVYYVVSSNKKGLELGQDAIITVDRGDLVSVYNASATVESGRQGAFEILDGTRVESVGVRVGDTVCKGDLLATFDAGSLDEMLRQKKRDYEAAAKSYREYMQGAANAPRQSAELKKQIAELEKKIAELQAQEEAIPPPEQSGSQQLDELKESIAGLLGNTRLANNIVDRVLAENGSVAQTITTFQNLLGGGLSGLIGGSMMGGMDLEAIMGSMGGAGMLGGESMQLSMQLIQLKAQEAMLGISGGVSLDSVYKSVADSAESAYRQAERTTALLKQGWYAEYDGIIREINIAEGEIYRGGAEQQAQAPGLDVNGVLAALTTGSMDIASMLGGLFSGTVSGMVVEYYPFTASFLLGKYDIAKVALDQKVRVTSVSGQEFSAFVSFISPVAQDSSAFNISSIMGGAGTSRGVEARITIPEPDKSITIGLDVDVVIELDTKENVLRVPVESVQIDDESSGYYVFVVERVSKTIHKRPVQTGMFDGNAYYEVLGGLEEGTEIVRAPQRTMKDGEKVRFV